jgi:hypothetical protein
MSRGERQDAPHLAGALERSLGALGDWLELLRAHELRRRDTHAANRRARRTQLAVVLVAAVCAALVFAFAAIARGR